AKLSPHSPAQTRLRIISQRDACPVWVFGMSRHAASPSRGVQSTVRNRRVDRKLKPRVLRQIQTGADSCTSGGRCDALGGQVFHPQPPVKAWSLDDIPSRLVERRWALHEISKMRFRVPARLDEIHQVRFARLKLLLA